MAKNEQNKNHELDLEFVKRIGGINNNAKPLADREFLTKVKATEVGVATSNLFMDSAIEEFGFKRKK